MKYIADLHIHSHYSMATSKDLVPEKLDLWARKKGISLVGTGDLTHEGWRKELREKLTEAGDGFYRLKEEYREAISLLKKDYAIRDVGKSSEKGISTIQRVKKECC